MIKNNNELTTGKYRTLEGPVIVLHPYSAPTLTCLIVPQVENATGSTVSENLVPSGPSGEFQLGGLIDLRHS